MKKLLRWAASLPIIGKSVFKYFGKKYFVVLEDYEKALVDDFGQMYFKTERYATFVANEYYKETGKMLSVERIIVL